MRFTSHILTALCLAAAALIAGCAGGTTGDSSGPDTLRVGISTNYPPVAFRDGGEIAGIEADLARALAPTLDMRLEFVETPWESLIPALRSGRIDVIMSGMSVTEDRAAQVNFVTPYLRTGQMALIRSADAARLGSPANLYGTTGTVGFETGTTGEMFVRGTLKAATPEAFSAPDEGVAALREGRVDVFIHDAPTIWRVAGDKDEREIMGLFWPLTEEYLAWAVARNNDELLRRMNARLKVWKLTGELQAILNRWIRLRVEVQAP